MVFLLFIWAPLLLTWFFAMLDLFVRPDLSGAKKVTWLLAILFLPLVGTIAYFVARPKEPTERSHVARDPLAVLDDLHRRGVINDAEYEAQRADLLLRPRGAT